MAQSLKQSVVDHYEAALKKHGATPQGMDWKDEASQRLRFDILCQVCTLQGRSLHEVGAGVGHLYEFLQDQQIDTQYSGSDLSGEMVAAARRRLPHVPFDHWDILQEASLPTYDVLVCSGLFYVKLGHSDEQWWEFVQAMIRRMYAQCRIGIAVNMITDQVDFKTEELFYCDPGRMLDFARRELSRNITLRHDYPLYEFTTYIYRNAVDDSAGS